MGKKDLKLMVKVNKNVFWKEWKTVWATDDEVAGLRKKGFVRFKDVDFMKVYGIENAVEMGLV